MIAALFTTILTVAATTLQPSTASFAYAHHPLSNVTPAEQALFDRTLTLYYAYNGAEGARILQAALARDPKFAMGYWGLALSYSPDINTDLTEDHFKRAQAAIAKAAALKSAVSPAELTYIEAMQLRYAGSWADHDKAESAYRDAMAAAVARYPSDDDLTALDVEALLEKYGRNAWKTGTNTPTTSATLTMASLLDRIVARNPQHIMANHLQIHLFEDAADHSRSIAAAKRLDAMNFAPENEHLAHMPAHAWIDVGSYGRSIASSRRAISLFDQYLSQPDVDRAHRGYLGHDIEVGWGAALMLGNYSSAKSFASRFDSFRDTNTAQHMTALRFEDTKALAALQSDSQAPKDERAIFAAYLAILQGNVGAARTSLLPMLTAKEKSPITWAMAARLKLLEGDRSAAAVDFRKAQDLEDDQFGGEELPRVPVGEIEGFGYFRSGNFAQAEAAFRATLKRYPNDPRALYGLSQTLLKEAKSVEAQRVAADFRKAWQGADVSLSIQFL